MDFPRSLRLWERAAPAFIAEVMRVYAACWSAVGLLARSRFQVMVAAATCSRGAGAAGGGGRAAPGAARSRGVRAAVASVFRGFMWGSSCGGWIPWGEVEA